MALEFTGWKDSAETEYLGDFTTRNFYITTDCRQAEIRALSRISTSSVALPTATRI
jgi:hypothetical protein